MSIKRVYIVRHGETEYNVQHRWQGQLDTPLNDVGQQQAQALATYLSGTPIDAIFSSDLKRTMDTGIPYAQANNLTIIPDERLREIHLGVFQGLKRSEIHDAYPHEAMRWDQDDSFIVPNGESRKQVQARTLAAWQEITARTEFETIMVISHGGALRMLLKQIFPHHQERLHFGNTSITILDRDTNEQWRLSDLNTVPHLA